MTFIILYKLTTSKAFTYPLILIEYNPFFTSIYLSFKADNKPFMLLWIKYSLIFSRQYNKLCDDVIDFIDIEMFE